MFFHINLSAFPLILLAVIVINNRMNVIQNTQTRLFNRLVLFSFLLILLELLSWMVDRQPAPVVWAANMLYLTLVPIMPLIWLRYVYYNVYNKMLTSARRPLQYTLFGVLLLYYLPVLSSPWTSLIFFVDEHGCYARGQLFFLVNVVTAFFVLISTGIAWAAARRESRGPNRDKYYSFAFFSSLPAVADAVQGAVPGIWIALQTTAVAELLAYVSLQTLAIKRDGLTGINNRGCFDSYIQSLLNKQEKRDDLCLFLLDLNEFKSINDDFGHDVGDKALVRFAEILSSFLHRRDAFLARYGGDEFCILTHCDSKEQAGKIAEDIAAAFAAADAEEKAPYKLSCSVGYCLLPKGSPACSPDEMVRRADAMLYEVKERGRAL